MRVLRRISLTMLKCSLDGRKMALYSVYTRSQDKSAMDFNV